MMGIALCSCRSRYTAAVRPGEATELHGRCSAGNWRLKLFCMEGAAREWRQEFRVRTLGSAGCHISWLQMPHFAYVRVRKRWAGRNLEVVGEMLRRKRKNLEKWKQLLNLQAVRKNDCCSKSGVQYIHTVCTVLYSIVQVGHISTCLIGEKGLNMARLMQTKSKTDRYTCRHPRPQHIVIFEWNLTE